MATKTRSNGQGSLWLRWSRNVVNRDPEIDKMKMIWQKERIKETDLAVLAGLADSTVKNMFGGQTMQPRHSTFSKMAGAFGMRYELVRDDEKPNYEKEIPKAKEERKTYRTQLTQMRESGSKKKSRVNKSTHTRER